MKKSIYITILFGLLYLPSHGQINWFNRPPTIDEIEDYGPVAENSGPHTVTLTGISPGRGERNQQVTISATSNNADLITNLLVDYKQGEEADLSFDLVTNANGKSRVIVTVDDGELFRNTTTETFEIEVYAVNGEPTFILTSDLVVVDENAGKIEISSFAINIDDGDPEEDQKLKFVANLESITNNLTFKSEPAVDKNGTLKFEALPDAYGEARYILQLTDNGGAKDGGDDTSTPIPFTIRVSDINRPPTIDPVDVPVVLKEDEGERTILLTGISPGLNETQQLQISVSVDDQNLITIPTVDYTSGSVKADLTFSTRPDQFGEAGITVLLDDGQPENNTTSIQILVVVEPVADTPSISDALTDAGVQTKSGLVITRNSLDGSEVTHYRISNIFNGQLYQSDGITPIVDNEFITHQQGNAGLKFTPFPTVSSDGGFFVQAATGPEDDLLGGNVVAAKISISNDPPEFTSDPITSVIVTKQFIYDITTSDVDGNDVLTFTFLIPEEIQAWLKATDFGDGTARIFGIPPEGAAGQYPIVVIVEDQFGAADQQDFVLIVQELNKPPQLSSFTIEIDEDDTITLNQETFQPWFTDPDGDSIQAFQLVSNPIYGSVVFNGRELQEGEIVEMDDKNAFFYIPERNYFGLDVFDWNLSDGNDFAMVSQRTNIVISSVFDPPEIRNLETVPINLEYGDEYNEVTETGQIYDEDSESLERATFSFSSGYVRGEDSLRFEQLEGLEFSWNEDIGVLNVEGRAPITYYQQILSSLWYFNKKSLSPTTETRQIGIVLYDSDTVSQVYYRQVEFGNSFEDLNLNIPTGFTPNGDGINDVWYVENLNRYPNFKIEVYSRGGKRLFEANNRAIGWDGKHDGSLVPAGTYYYFINLSNYDRVFKGSVTVLR